MINTKILCICYQFDWLDGMQHFTVYPASPVSSRTVKVTVLQHTPDSDVTPGFKEIKFFEVGPLGKLIVSFIIFILKRKKKFREGFQA